MICPKCQHENHPGARFCSKCGLELVPVVPVLPEESNGVSRTILFFLALLSYVTALYFIDAIESYLQLLLIDVLFALIVIVFFVIDFRKSVLLFRIPKFSPALLISIIAGAPIFALIIFYFTGYLNESLFDRTQVAYYEQYADSPSPLFFTILSVGFFPAVFEEIACRGIMFNQLEKIAGASSTIIITAIIFTMLHLSLISILWIFPIGLLFGYLRARYNTIVMSTMN